jgi:cell division protease FtsH
MSVKSKIAITCAAAIAIGTIWWSGTSSPRPLTTISYSQFLDQVRAGRVASVSIFGDTSGTTPATCRLQNGDTVRTVLPSDYRDALAVMLERSVNVEIQDASSEPLRLLLNATPFLLLLALWLFFFFRGFPHGDGPLNRLRQNLTPTGRQ